MPYGGDMNKATVKRIAYSPSHLGAAVRVEVFNAEGKNCAGATVKTMGAAKTWAKRYGGKDVIITDITPMSVTHRTRLTSGAQ
jgi:hypothetical protein